jgi:hypothetical protein
MVLSRGPLSVFSPAKVHCLDILLLAVDFACAGGLLLSTAALGLGYQHQTPAALQAKINEMSEISISIKLLVLCGQKLMKFHLTHILQDD